MISFKDEIKEGIPSALPSAYVYDDTVSHAPHRVITSLTAREKALALKNALRYFDESQHGVLAPEFAYELETYGRIYMYRYMPTYEMKARPVEDYPYQSKQAAAIMLMIQNNLDYKVAKHPHELITYGGNGAVFQNWAQYLLTMQYLSEMTDEQTLVLYSGHPMGLFPSHTNAPRVVVTNGMMIPNYSSKADWNKYNALGVTSYGQMTAGSFMYIGPQGIVHGTTITLLNAGRKMGLGTDNLAGKVYVTSGLGGMSGAQALAAIITGAVGVLAEIDPDAVQQRLTDGYIKQEDVYTDLPALLDRMEQCRKAEQAAALVYHGNIVDLWEAHVTAINKLSAEGMYFWDYGNAFLKEAGEVTEDIWADGEHLEYKYPSYVEDIMGPMCFDYGFGPFRWVCASGDMDDLRTTDAIAAQVLEEMYETAPQEIKGQLNDNIIWIKSAEQNIPVVGSKSRILYADAEGRIKIALAFNQAIKDGRLSGPVVLGRDHHDVSGTDSPYRETSNIRDGSRYTADMAVHNFVGDSFRGATWISLHNGGGVGPISKLLCLI